MITNKSTGPRTCKTSDLHTRRTYQALNLHCTPCFPQNTIHTACLVQVLEGIADREALDLRLHAHALKRIIFVPSELTT